MTRRNPPISTQFAQTLQRVIRFLSRPNTYTLILFFLVVLLVFGTVLVWWFEHDPHGEPALRSLENAFVFMLQNVSGVGIGAAVPLTLAGRVTGIIFVILAAGSRAIFIAAVVSGFVNRLLLHGKGLGRVNAHQHVIVAGWNSGAKQIVQVLQHEAFGAGVPIVLLANLKEHPFPDSKVKFVAGDPTNYEDLERAGVKTARSAIVITDESDGERHSDSTYDARAVLTVLAFKSAAPDIHVVAQVRDPANRHHFERACADEMIVSAEMSEGLLARAAVNVGIAHVYSDLLRLDTSSEMYVLDAPPALVGKSFQAALVYLNERQNAVLVGVIQDHVMLSPPHDYKIDEGTRLVIVSRTRPALDR
jgi:voltage-gated potassium channel